MFADLPKEVATQKRPTEISWMLAALGALLASAAVAGVDALESVPVADASLSERQVAARIDVIRRREAASVVSAAKSSIDRERRVDDLEGVYREADSVNGSAAKSSIDRVPRAASRSRGCETRFLNPR